MASYWKGASETLDPAVRASRHSAALAAHAPAVYASSAFYRERFDGAGIDPAAVTLDTLSSLPAVTKQDIISDQAANPPYGTMIGCDPADIVRQYIGPGPQTTYFTKEDLEIVVDDGSWCFFTNGFRASDVVDVTIMYHWVIAGTLMDQSYRKIGCAVIPGGIGMSQQHVDTWLWSGVTGLFAFPTFLDELGKHVEERGIDPASELSLRVCTISGEQRTADAKERMESLWGGMKVREIYGGSEVPFVAAEGDDEGGMYLNPDFIVEVVDPETLQGVGPGEPGVMVVTDTRRRAYPMLRYFTGDITEGLTYEPGPSGRTTPRMGRILGRHGDIPRVKGLFVVPGQVQGILDTFDGLGRFQLVIDRPGTQDTLQVIVEHEGVTSDRPSLGEKLVGALKDGMRLTCDVDLVDRDTLADDAAVIDDRRQL